MATVILFDVNETLLDTRALEPEFERMFGDPRVRTEWFLTLEETWLTDLVVGDYHDFAALVRAALHRVAEGRGASVSREDGDRLIERILSLPPHPEVEEALRALRDGGLRLAALTNGTADALRRQMDTAGLADHFEALYSADDVRRLKPAPEPYAMAARRLGVEPGRIRMVACHAWDIVGAAAAGLATGFVRRPGKSPNPLAAPPGLQGDDLLDLARRILHEDAGAS